MNLWQLGVVIMDIHGYIRVSGRVKEPVEVLLEEARAWVLGKGHVVERGLIGETAARRVTYLFGGTKKRQG